jgi:hypothetical protein
MARLKELAARMELELKTLPAK